jgi:outer membrane protein assembly factor BamD
MINEKAKQELMKAYDDQAADAYGRVVTHYSMAAHVEDARERLIALNRPVPEPTKEELADSEAEEQSRTGITFKDRALLLVKRGPVTVNAARIGEPTMTDVPQVTAPDVHKQDTALFTAALTNKPLPSVAVTHTATAVASGETPPPAPDSGSALTLENVPGADNGGGAPAGGGPQIGASIVQPGEAPASTPATSGPPTSEPATAVPVGPKVTPEGAAAAADAAGVPGAQNPGGLEVIRPANNEPLPPIEKPAEAPAQTNDVQHTAAQVQTGTDAGATPTNGKKKKAVAPKCNQGDESCSKEKKKKGLDKLNPF